MARYSKTQSDFSIPRSSTTRIFAILTLALPVIFYLLSLAFALKTIYEPAYAESIVYDDVPEIANATNTTTPLTQKSSPFYAWYVPNQLNRYRELLNRCSTVYPAGNPLSDIQATKQTCAHEHLWGSEGFAICRAYNAGDQHVCQQRVYSAGLYVAGTSLAGLALLSALIALGLGFSRATATSETPAYAALYSRLAQGSHSHHGHHHHRHQQDEGTWKSPQDQAESDPAEDSGTDDLPQPTATNGSTTWRNFALALGILLAVLSSLCLFVAHYLAYNALVNDQAPSGDATLSQTVSAKPIQSPWYLTHTGVVYASMAWLTAGLGALIASLGSCLGGL